MESGKPLQFGLASVMGLTLAVAVLLAAARQAWWRVLYSGPAGLVLFAVLIAFCLTLAVVVASYCLETANAQRESKSPKNSDKPQVPR